jgi:hypothetical protein
MKLLLLLAATLTVNFVTGQDPNRKEADNTLPYSDIPTSAEKYTASTVSSHLIDGLGFRFYWATAGLRNEDLAYRASKETRSILETIAHIYEMSLFIRNAVGETINPFNQSASLPFNEIRKKTLENFKKAQATF